MRKKLLQKDQDFNYALAIALADEAACREAGQLNSSLSSGDAHHTKDKHRTYPSKVHNTSKKNTATSVNPPFKSYKCFSCGSTAHHRDKCKLRDATSDGCAKKGHKQSVCGKREVNQVTEEDVEEE